MTHEFFWRNPFKADAATDLENDARLALHLVLFLLASQDTSSGCWDGGHSGARLRNTCHALEALHMYDPHLAADALETGIAWLVNLPDVVGLTGDDDELLRLYPSRFKTLAWLGEFRDRQLRVDFEDLSRCLDSDGTLRGVMAKQSLATMVYADCLDHLAMRRLMHEPWDTKRNQVLDNILRQVELWHANHLAKDSASESLSAGELSYGLDLLLRVKRTDIVSTVALDAQKVLIAAIQAPVSRRPLSSDTLYCAIQLATHFQQSPVVKQVLTDFITELRTKYEQQDLRKENFFFHPLVLRFLLIYHGDQLKSEVSRLLLGGQQERMKMERQSEELRLREDFQTLVKNSLEVQVSDIKPLTGGISRAQVFRVYYAVKTRHTNEKGEIETSVFISERSSMVIKQGRIDTLHTSIRRYQSLPGPVRGYFAKHEGNPVAFGARLSAPAYLIMEDLTHMQTLRDVLDPIDQRTLPRGQQVQLKGICDVTCNGLFAIYDQTKRAATEFSGSQLSRLYISDLEKSLIRMCREGSFPHLKTWHKGFKLGSRKYRSIGYYLGKLESHRAKLKVPYLMLTHGDCHSRNLMLDPENRYIKLVDLDNLDYDGDYLRDLALLIEDVCVFRFLFDENYRFHVDRERVHLISPPSNHKVIQNQIEYPPFSSATTLMFQQCMLTRVESYARKIGDKSWKERLWLALAVSLLYLVPKHSEKEIATILYAEAVKLLDDLVLHLSGEFPLPDLPFSEHGRTLDDIAMSEPFTGAPNRVPGSARLAALHEAILSINPDTIAVFDATGCVVRYFRTGSEHPYAIVDARKPIVSVLLACSIHELDDTMGMAQVRGGSKSILRTLLEIPENIEIATLLPMIRRVFLLPSSQKDDR